MRVRYEHAHPMGADGRRHTTEVDIDTAGHDTIADTLRAIAASNERGLRAIDDAAEEAFSRGESLRYCAGPGAPVVEYADRVSWERQRAREVAWNADRAQARRAARWS